MGFRPTVGGTLRIDQTNWRVAEHPSAPGMPYGQEGRAGVVYQLTSDNGEKRALKVFRERFRVPSLVSLSQRLMAFADLPGLEVCRRNVLTPDNHRELLQKYPELIYAVWMPWIEGPTWMEIVLDISEGKRVLTKDQSLTLSHALVRSLTAMEQHGVAHGDLSGPNVILPGLNATFTGRTNAVALVDVEQMYAPGLEKPTLLSSGSSGYAHPQAKIGMWTDEADRFAGAVMLAEMLGMCDSKVSQAAWGESYFEAGEIQTESQRYTVLYEALQSNWGEKVGRLFARAWASRDLKDCPTFGEWQLALPELEYSGETGSGKEKSGIPFQQAIEAIRYQEWGKAKENLMLILREKPDYRFQEQSARELLNEVERKLRQRPFPSWAWGIIGGVITLLVILGILSFNPFRPITPTMISPSRQGSEFVQEESPLSVILSPTTILPVRTFTPFPTSFQPNIAPSGHPTGKIVFTCQISKDENRNQICIVNADGTGYRRLTSNDRSNNFYPSLAPDGNSIVYSSNETGEHEIYEMDLRGNQTRLTNMGELYAPEISPDGRYIVFTNAIHTYSTIWIMNRDGSNSHEIYSEVGNDVLDPTWSPDGSKILFAKGDGESKKLYTINKNGSGLQVVNSNFSTRGRNDWSIDDDIVGYSGQPWQRNIYIMFSDGSGLTQLTDGGNSQAPSFSPDGKWIAFTGYFDHMGDNDGCEIFIMAKDGQELTPLTDNDYCDWQPRWGP